MSQHTFFIAPTGFGVGLTSTSLGLIRALERTGLRVHFLKPIAQPHPGDEGPERIGHDRVAGANMGNQFIRCGALGCCILQVAKPQARVPVEASAVRKKKVMFIEQHIPSFRL